MLMTSHADTILMFSVSHTRPDLSNVTKHFNYQRDCNPVVIMGSTLGVYILDAFHTDIHAEALEHVWCVHDITR